MKENFSLAESFQGRSVFMIGGTGFVGKVALSLLLYRFPNLRRVYATVRARSQAESETRFWNHIVTSPPFDPLRELYGAAFEDFINDKVRVVGGDIGEQNFGFTEAEAQSIASDIDVVINSAGNVTFNPTLESALRTNVVGTRNVIEFTKRMPRPALVHVSTCFVAGNRSGAVWENEPVTGYFPRRGEIELRGVEFTVEGEIKDCERLSERVRDEARDSMMIAKFREGARKRLIDEGRDPDDLDTMGLAVARERKIWIKNRLTELGIERARWWGWPNIYTYTKSLGEQMVVGEENIVRAIVRPSIVESALSYPFSGWNEGFTTTAPLIFIALKGQTQVPVNNKLILDITPVDQVASVMIAVAARACIEQPERMVFQAATGDSNPAELERIVGLLGLYKRDYFQKKETGFSILNEIAGRMEISPVSLARFDRTSTPMVNAVTKKLSTWLDHARPRWGGGRVTDIIDRAKEKVDRIEQITRETQEAFEMFRPFMVENEYIFRADNVRELFLSVREEERNIIPWYPEKIDWYDYWINAHLPGLQKWVFPTLEEDMRAQPKRIYTYRDLLELFETSTKRHATRVAMRIERDGQKEQYTYADLQELATRAAGFFVARGVRVGDRVMLLAKNAPEWGISYFGVMKAGAICVPLSPDSSTQEVVNFARAGHINGLILSEEMEEKHTSLRTSLLTAGFEDLKIWRFEEIFALQPKEDEEKAIALLPKRVHANSVASLIFTSGTTGQPKGVMLSHRNFTHMVSMLSSVFEMSTSDGVLSILPLHHTFEFSTGFLVPLSRGAQITYLAEINSEELARSIKNGHVTGMVGVPALWELLHRRIWNRFNEKGEWARQAAELLAQFNGWLRNRTPINLGQVIFYPVHKGLGGRIRYLISGGSTLNEKIKRELHGLGFTILEGYGLTEASPVLTVVRPRNDLLESSVGKALPGVEVKIIDPDASGVGEVTARGPNIMLGYYENEEATRAILRDRWLSTGDLGRLDTEGNLYLVGRSKDIIIDNNGKNIYPDEIEELYCDSPFIKELSIVGLPNADGVSEKIACLVVPDYDYDIALSREETRRKIEEHTREISTKLPFFKRIKILHFWDGELSRTDTRKVKRREVLATIHVLEESMKSVRLADARTEKSEHNEIAWLLNIVATVSNRPYSYISLNTRLSDLGFDSLMFVELMTAIENVGGKIESAEALVNVNSVRELGSVVTRTSPTRAHKTTDISEEVDAPRRTTEGDEIYIPSFLSEAGKKGLGFLQRALYERILIASYEGRSNIPVSQNFLVAANHASHLDMGLVRMALDEYGKEMVALAARDYFFDTKYKRAYMENFTNLVPIERTGSLRKSLRHARSYLERGYNALIFPEGTRSLTGEIHEFKSVIGYLALNCKIGILPIYLHGTYEAFPKGANFLKGRSVGARIGRFLEYEELEGMTRSMARSEAYRLIAAYVRHQIINLRDKTRAPFDVAQHQQSLRAEKQALVNDVPTEEFVGVGE